MKVKDIATIDNNCFYVGYGLESKILKFDKREKDHSI
jgi:hypothetical protein